MFREQVFCRYVARRICVEVVVSSTNTREFFFEKKKFVHAPSVKYVHANNEHCIAGRSPCFGEQYFVQQNKGFVPYLSCWLIVYGRPYNSKLRKFHRVD